MLNLHPAAIPMLLNADWAVRFGSSDVKSHLLLARDAGSVRLCQGGGTLDFAIQPVGIRWPIGCNYVAHLVYLLILGELWTSRSSSKKRSIFWRSRRRPI